MKRLEQMKLLEANRAKIIDAQPINGKPRETKPQIETKPPPARTPDRRFRRFCGVRPSSSPQAPSTFCLCLEWRPPTPYDPEPPPLVRALKSLNG